MHVSTPTNMYVAETRTVKRVRLGLGFCFQVDQTHGNMLMTTATSPMTEQGIAEKETLVCTKFDEGRPKDQKVKVYFQPENNDCKDRKYINKIIASMSNPFGHAFFVITDDDENATECNY